MVVPAWLIFANNTPLIGFFLRFSEDVVLKMARPVQIRWWQKILSRPGPGVWSTTLIVINTVYRPAQPFPNHHPTQFPCYKPYLNEISPLSGLQKIAVHQSQGWIQLITWNGESWFSMGGNNRLYGCSISWCVVMLELVFQLVEWCKFIKNSYFGNVDEINQQIINQLWKSYSPVQVAFWAI